MPLFQKKPDNKGPVAPEVPIELSALGGDGAARQTREIAARQMEAMPFVKARVFDAIAKRAEKIMFDYTKDATNTAYLIDGMWHNVEVTDRVMGDAMLVAMKTLCGAKPEERRARQEGQFGVEHQTTRVKFECTLTSQGVQTGERVIVLVRPKKYKPLSKYEELGMREATQEKIREFMRLESGLVLVSAPPNGGFTSFWNATLNSTDRYLRDFVGIEDKHSKETTAENVNMTYFDANAGETPEKIIKSVLLKQPDVFTFSDLFDATTANKAFELALDHKKLVVAGVKGRDTVEAMLRVLLLKCDPQRFADALKLVINTRLIRKLNETCKQGYQPPPQLLQKLGIPPDRVKLLFREWQPPPPLPPEEAKKQKKKELPPGACPLCELVGTQCQGLFYYGRTGLFEFLEVNDKIREALVKQPKLEVLRNLARAAGQRGLQEEGLLLVAKGTTSLDELKRALK